MKEGVLKYVKIMKRLWLVFSIVAIPALMVFIVMAINDVNRPLFIALAVVLGLAYFILYGFYTVNVTLGAVMQIEVNKKVFYLKTSRKTFTYDLRQGCVGMKVYKNRFVGTFRTQDSEDKFIFYRRVLFSPYSEEQFTPDDIRLICPDIDLEDV